MAMTRYCVEVGCESERKGGETAPGDTFLSRKVDGGKRVITVLSDGLGSGIKAGVLSSLTATAALNTMEQNLSPRKTAELIYRTLPVCSERKISYSTFTVADIRPGQRAEIVEFDNPPYLLIRDGALLPVEKRQIGFSTGGSMRKMELSGFTPRYGDRILFFTDGVTQSGMGTGSYPLGWGSPAVEQFVLDLVNSRPDISARELSQKVLARSLRNDIFKARDDITCSVIYIRPPRRMILFTGPPYRKQQDGELAHRFDAFEGRRVICGGTTASIIARELQRPISVELSGGGDLPPPSQMDGADYVAEGILTLGRLCDYLEAGIKPQADDPASSIMEMMLDSDRIRFVVGTRINEAHQDPNMPVELEIRRNVVKKICRLLEKQHLKETELEYI